MTDSFPSYPALPAALAPMKSPSRAISDTIQPSPTRLVSAQSLGRNINGHATTRPDDLCSYSSDDNDDDETFGGCSFDASPPPQVMTTPKTTTHRLGAPRRCVSLGSAASLPSRGAVRTLYHVRAGSIAVANGSIMMDSSTHGHQPHPWSFTPTSSVASMDRKERMMDEMDGSFHTRVGGDDDLCDDDREEDIKCGTKGAAKPSLLRRRSSGLKSLSTKRIFSGLHSPISRS